MSKVIMAHDMPKRMHPALQTAIHELAHTRNVKRPDLSLGRIALLAFSAMEYDIQVDKIQIVERLLGTRRAERI
jgi:hypothetical protein